MARSKVFTVLWSTHTQILERIRDSLDVDLEIFQYLEFERSGGTFDDILSRMGEADVVVMYRQSTSFCAELVDKIRPLKDSMKIINFANDPSLWDLTSVNPQIAVDCYRYMFTGGDENFVRMFDYIQKKLLGKIGEPLPVYEVPWQGVLSMRDNRVFDSVEEYMDACGIDRTLPRVGIIGSRPTYLMDGLKIEREMCSFFEKKGIVPILIYSAFSGKPEFGCINPGEALLRYFSDNGNPKVDAIVKCTTAFIGLGRDSKSKVPMAGSMEPFEELNIPIFQPVMTAEMTVEEWRNCISLTSDLVWQVSFPEFEGIVDPMVIGSDIDDNGERRRTSIKERMERFVGRVSNNILLRHKPNSEKKVVIFLNNFPCAGVEANVGNAAGLDSLESIADLMKALKSEGYTVHPPKDGKDLINRILEKKALSEFRWTTAQEIRRHNGTVYEMDMDEYLAFFHSLSEEAQADVIETWGVPPGQGMVIGGKLMITGVNFGNVMVAVQPKRGCFGSRCDGQVCKILHDPACPPTHQYLATYHYYEHIWGADAVIHTGTHGSMEWTPGKGVGLSESCYPDICMWDTPHFYIYNSDNPSEGIVAKRRSYATLIDHMQHLMTEVNLYDEYAELDRMLADYPAVRNDPVQSYILKKDIIAKAETLKFEHLGLDENVPLQECVRRCHEELSKMRNSFMNKGLHIFGKMPSGEDRASAVNSIVRYGEEHDSLRDCIAELLDLDLSYLYEHKGEINEEYSKSNDELIRWIGDLTHSFVASVLDGKSIQESLQALNLEGSDFFFEKHVEMIKDIDSRIDSSDEIGALINALNGGFTSPGPSGYITRGKYDILPTGRNFYAMDPYAVPSTSAWKAGCRIAQMEIDRYLADRGTYPESMGFFWTMGELISTSGEEMSQIMYLLGAEPKWNSEGRVNGFKIIPLEILKRPRVDISINVSCILRDNMMNAIDYIDRVVSAVADLDEPLDMNYVRKHNLESISEGMSLEDANARMFGAPPGTYTSGVNLAVFASAWKEDKDITDVFVRTKGHGYGGGRNGRPMPEQFAKVLSKTDAVLEHSLSDEADVVSCSCHFSNIGGMVSASRYLSGKETKAYCVNARDPRDISVGTLKEEIQRVMRNKTLNPEWIKAMQEHGYKGANDMAKRVVNMFGWQSTTHEVDDWLFDEVVKTFVADPEINQFFKDNNPYALEELERRLLEAHSRGLWNTDDDTLEILQNAYLQIESTLEELAGEGEFQGGNIDIFDRKSVESWDSKAGSVSNITESLHKRNVN